MQDSLRKMIISCLMMTPMFAQVISLGEAGRTYEIAEPSFDKQINEGIKKIDLNHIQKKLIADVDKKANVSSELGSCIATKHRITENLYEFKRDYYDANNQLVYAKGDTIKNEVKRPIALCVVDGLNPLFAKVSLQKLLKKGSCDKVLVANGDFRKVRDIADVNSSFYPYHDMLTKAMKIKCLPSRSEANKESLIVDEISVQSIRDAMRSQK